MECVKSMKPNLPKSTNYRSYLRVISRHQVQGRREITSRDKDEETRWDLNPRDEIWLEEEMLDGGQIPPVCLGCGQKVTGEVS